MGYPPSKWGFRALGGPIRPEALLVFTSLDDATTEITSELTIPGILGALLIGPLLAQQKKNYLKLKHLLETR